MTKEFHYTHIEFPATEKVGEEKAPVVLPPIIPAAVGENDTLNMEPMIGMKAMKEAEQKESPTESQLFWRDMYRTGKLSPYQKDRPAVEWSALIDFGKKYIGHPIDFYTKSGKDIMELDMKLRGGADKEYNQLGDMGKRAKRMAVMVGNMVPAVALDILTSIPSGIGELALTKVLQGKLKEANLLSEENYKDKQDKKMKIGRLDFQIKSVRSGNRLFGIMNDKNVTAGGDSFMKWLTGESTGWFTGESSDKLNDFVTGAYGDYVEDFLNGPVIESIFRILYQIPVVGALAEQGWTRLTNFQTKSAYHKGNLKGVYAAAGMFVGFLRNIQDKPNKTPSWRISKKIWNSGITLYGKAKGQNVDAILATKDD